MFRFTIRDVLWLTLVTGIALGWCRGGSQFHRQTRKYRALCPLADYPTLVPGKTAAG